MRRPDVKVPGPVPFPADLSGGLDEPAMADLTRLIKPRSHHRSHAGISHERLARRRYAPCPRFWRLLCDPRSFRDTRRLANPEVSDGDVTLGWPWDAADRAFGPYGTVPRLATPVAVRNANSAGPAKRCNAWLTKGTRAILYSGHTGGLLCWARASKCPQVAVDAVLHYESQCG